MNQWRAGNQWRVGKKLGRTLYRDDVLVGMIDTPELAEEIVTTLNRSSTRVDDLRPTVVFQSYDRILVNGRLFTAGEE